MSGGRVWSIAGKLTNHKIEQRKHLTLSIETWNKSSKKGEEINGFEASLTD